MYWIVIEGVKPYDGRYELDLEGREFNTREWGWIKRLSGYLPLTAEAGFTGADPELFTALAVICLHRAGKIGTPEVPAVFERIADAPFGSSLKLDTDEAEEGEEGAEPAPPLANSNGNGSISGPALPTNSETSAESPSDYGTPASAISAWPPGE